MEENNRVFDAICKENGGRVPYFAYGSNTLSQLQDRVDNFNLVSKPAIARGFARIFAGYSYGRQGGVASLVQSDGDFCLGSVTYLSSEEFSLLDPYEGTRSGDPYSSDENTNPYYYRKWINIDEYGDQTDKAPIRKQIKAIAYVRSSNRWVQRPSDEYLSLCLENISNMWSGDARFTGTLIVCSEDGVEHDLELDYDSTALHSMHKKLWSNENNVKTSSSSERIPVYIADKKFLDVHTQLKVLRGWNTGNIKSPLEISDLKWRNYRECSRDFRLKAKVSSTRTLSSHGSKKDLIQFYFLNHISGARCMSLKNEFCWRVRAADLQTTQGAVCCQSFKYYPQCWDLGDPLDTYSFCVNFTIVAVLAAMNSCKDDVQQHEQPSISKNEAKKNTAIECQQAIESLLNSAIQICMKHQSPNSVHLLKVNASVLIKVLNFGQW